MTKRETVAFSVFGLFFALFNFIKNGSRARNFALLLPYTDSSGEAAGVPKEITQQIELMKNSENIAYFLFRALFIAFLLYIGWKIAYGFLSLKYIVPITLCILLVPALIEFAFYPKDMTVWYSFQHFVDRAAVWIAVMKLYYLGAKKAKPPHKTNNGRLAV